LSHYSGFSPEIRKMIYATNAIESYNSALRKYAKNKRSFVSNEALAKLLYTGRARYDVDPETVPGRSSERGARMRGAHERHR
jgi:transposase-like protein